MWSEWHYCVCMNETDSVMRCVASARDWLRPPRGHLRGMIDCQDLANLQSKDPQFIFFPTHLRAFKQTMLQLRLKACDFMTGYLLSSIEASSKTEVCLVTNALRRF